VDRTDALYVAFLEAVRRRFRSSEVRNFRRRMSIVRDATSGSSGAAAAQITAVMTASSHESS
jgi:hypothetical protein